jgi:release factor glutamine methyltransferase
LTVEQALRCAAIDAREARLLLAAASGFSQAGVVAFPERSLAPEVETRFRGYVERRAAGEPVAYILGRKEFYGLELSVDPAVLIPRPETELLVELALERPFASLVDLGTGSGAIALAVRRHRPHARVVAVEASAAALAVARRNAGALALEVEMVHGHWLAALQGQRFDLIVSNPPYVAQGDPHLEALRFEPASALLAGPDGLDAIRAIVHAAPGHLNPGAWLLLEHGIGQHGRVRDLLQRQGLEEVTTWPDLAGIPRVTGARVKR